MGYNIIIGNASLYHYEDEGNLYAGWEVEVEEHKDAPTFPNDEMTGNSNSRHPSYSGWATFCREANVVDVFYLPGERDFRGGHPGCSILKKSDLVRIREARIQWERISKLPAGFNAEGEEKYDSILARLIWLEWWIDWALTNCEIPAIENS